MIKKITLTTLSLVILLLIFPVKTYASSTGTIYLSPSSINQEVGSTFTVNLMINPGTNVNAVQADVDYNASDLQYVSNSLSGSAFPTCVQDSPGSSDVVFACTILAGSVDTNALIASITFKALTVGSTSLNLSNANAADNGNWTNPTSLNSSVSIYAPPTVNNSPTPTSNSNTTSISSSTNNNSSSYSNNSPSLNSPTTPPATPKTLPKSFVLKIDSLKIYANQALISVDTSNNPNVIIKYGQSQNNLNSQTNSLKTNGLTTIDLNNLLPKTTYYFQVYGSLNNQIENSSIDSFQTQGLNITLTILTNQFHPIANQIFYLNNINNKASTNQQGKITFYDQSPGVNQLIYFVNHKKYQQSIYIPSLYVNHNLLSQSMIVTIKDYHLASLTQSDLASIATILFFIILIGIRIIVGHRHHDLNLDQ